MKTQTITAVLHFGYHKEQNWMQCYAVDQNGNKSVKQIIPSAFSSYLQTDGSGIGRLYGHDLSAYIQAAPTREYVQQMICNFLNEAARYQNLPKMSTKDLFMEMREWENTHHMSYRHRKF